MSATEGANQVPQPVKQTNWQGKHLVDNMDAAFSFDADRLPVQRPISNGGTSRSQAPVVRCGAGGGVSRNTHQKHGESLRMARMCQIGMDLRGAQKKASQKKGGAELDVVVGTEHRLRGCV